MKFKTDADYVRENRRRTKIKETAKAVLVFTILMVPAFTFYFNRTEWSLYSLVLSVVSLLYYVSFRFFTFDSKRLRLLYQYALPMVPLSAVVSLFIK